MATLDQIAEKKFSLAIPLYVSGGKAADVGDQVDILDSLANWRAAAIASDTAIVDAIDLLRAQVSV